MNNNRKAPAGLSESTDDQPNHERQAYREETLAEIVSPPMLSQGNQELGQKTWNDRVVGSVRAPPMLLTMAENETCQPTNQVQVQEQVPNQVSMITVKKEGPRKKPKRMTPRRREIITGYFLEVHANLGKYGNVGGSTWMNELLHRIRGESGRFDYVQITDVVMWLNLAEFKDDYDKLVKLEKEPQGTSSPASSASDQPLQNGEPIGSKGPARIAPPHQPAPFATAFAAAAAAQVKNTQTEPASSNLQGILGDGGIIYQTKLPEHSAYFVNHVGLPILPDDLWHHTKTDNRQQVQPELFFQPGGILLQLPPSATPTTLYIHPTSWAAYVSNCTENSGGGDGATGANEEQKFEAVKQEKHHEQQLKKEAEEDNAESDFSRDQFMGYMGEPSDAQE